MSDPDERQTTAKQRQGVADGNDPHYTDLAPSHEHSHRLTHGQVERIEKDVREEVAATDPPVSDS